jgi:hypothetical protein
LISRRVAAAVRRGDGRVIVCLPPRHGKSELVSHWTPTWFLDLQPERRVILASYAHELAASFGRRVRNTIEAQPARLRVRVAEDSRAADRFTTLHGGGLLAAGVGGGITGFGAHVLVLDDVVKDAEAAGSATQRAAVWQWYASVARPRLEPSGSIVVVGTRWHQDDLIGRLIAQQDAGGERWDTLILPALAEAHDPLGRPEGAALWPERYGADALAAIKQAVGSQAWASLYQQRPSPAEGGLLKRGWWRFYRDAPAELDEVIQSWDLAFKDTRTSDYVVGQVWGRRGAGYFLLDQVRARGSTSRPPSRRSWPSARAGRGRPPSWSRTRPTARPSWRRCASACPA